MKTVITIGRQFGSGGREIGEKIAAHFGIKLCQKYFMTDWHIRKGRCIISK